MSYHNACIASAAHQISIRVGVSESYRMAWNAAVTIQRSFALESEVRFADQNEAAGAADAAALVVPSIRADVRCGSQEVLCDPSTQDHAGGTPAP